MSITYKNGLGLGSDGYYHYCVRHDGQLLKGNTWATTPKTAAQVLKQILDDQALENVGLGRTKPPLMKDLLDQWEAENVGVLSEGHTESTLCKLRRNLGPLLNQRCDHITRERVAELRKRYLETLGPTGKARSAGGANSLIKSLKAVLGWAVENKKIRKMPFSIRRIKVKKKARRVIPLKDSVAFLAAIDAPYPFTGKKHCPLARPKNPDARLAVRLMLGLGLREHESLNARWEGVSFTERVYYAGETKNGEPRIIPFPTWLLEDLEQWPGRRTEGLMMVASVDKEGVEYPHDSQFTKKILSRAGKDLGIPGITPHRLRATFATNHARSGTPIDDIRIMLDHADIATTMIYIESFVDDLAAHQEKVGTLMGLNPTPSEAACSPTVTPPQKPKPKAPSKSAIKNKRT